MGRLSRYVAVVTAVLCVASSAAAQAQDRTATLRISVEDAQSGAIKSVKLTLTDKANGTARDAATDKAGKAAFEGLAAGEYVLKAEAKGFGVVQKPVTVGVTDPAPVTLKLQVEVNEDVTVTGGLSPVNRTAVDQNADLIKLGNGMLTGLPLLMDTAQVEVFIGTFMSPLAGQGNLTIVVDGLQVDSAAVPTAAVRQVAINKNPYSPEFRQLGKARVEILTESGSTRHYNAHVGFTTSDSSMDARNAFALDKPYTHKNLTETGFSGPIGRKLGSFLVSSEHLSDQESSVVNAVTLAGPVNSTMPLFSNSTTAFARADLRLSSADHLSVNFSSVQQGWRNLDVGGLLLPEQAVARHYGLNQARVSLVSKLSARATNELRFFAGEVAIKEGGPATGPTIDVRGAFLGGFNVNYLKSAVPTMQFHDNVTYVRRNHEIEFGGGMRLSHADISNATNFGGTFEFDDLNQFAAGAPSLYYVNQGNPTVRYSRPQGDLFFQDQVKLGPSVTVMAGARADFEGGIHDQNNIAPRLAAAYSPGKQKTVYRVGTGLFYVHFSDKIREQTQLYDGIHTSQIQVEDPSYPNPFTAGQAQTIPSSIVRTAPGMVFPYLIQSTASVERVLGSGTTVTLEYEHINGYHLFRALDVNLPQPGTNVVPNPAYNHITQVESTGILRGNGLTFTLNSRITNVWKASAIYTFSKTLNNTSGPLALPADNFNLAPEWGRADYDIRHKFNLASVFTLPLDFQLGTVLNLASGAPYDILTGVDNNGDGQLNDRPAGVTRNAGQSPDFAKLDLRLMKRFSVGRPGWAGKDAPSHLELNVDAFNVLNRKNLAPPIDVQNSPLFGQSVTALSPRTIQLSLKYFF